MKKTMTTLIASVMAVSAVSAASFGSVYAADDLGALASSLGADTDYLNFPFVEEYTIGDDENAIKGYSDKSFYYAAMEVLVHNGEQKISDLQADASEMTDIEYSLSLSETIKDKFDELVDRVIYNYTYKNTSAKDKIPALLSTAEKANANKEYFHIGYRDINYKYVPDASSDAEEDLLGHYVTGIGMTDGSWTFNEKNYDKCILTLDNMNTIDGEKAFSEDTCIYINSETYDYYIPKYSDSAKEDIHIIALDDDAMLNSDTSDIFNIRLGDRPKCFYTITSTKLGVETIRNEENEFLDYCHNAYNGNLYIKADDIKIDCDSDSSNSMTVTNNDSTVEMRRSAGISTFTFDGKKYCVSGSYSETSDGAKENQMNNYFCYSDSKSSCDFYGRILDGFTFEPSDGSFFVDNSAGVRFVSNSKEMGNIFVSEKTEVKYDENGITGFFIDNDKDGKFEHKVEVGDTNCDGRIDASDASNVLAAYSAVQTGEKHFINEDLGDFNEDNVIDSSDASMILHKYAELSTTK